MKKANEFPFDKARRITAKETESARKAIEAKTGKERPKRGRPQKQAAEKYRAVSIRLHPKVLVWAKKEPNHHPTSERREVVGVTGFEPVTSTV